MLVTKSDSYENNDADATLNDAEDKLDEEIKDVEAKKAEVWLTITKRC